MRYNLGEFFGVIIDLTPVQAVEISESAHEEVEVDEKDKKN